MAGNFPVRSARGPKEAPHGLLAAGDVDASLEALGRLAERLRCTKCDSSQIP
jgi:hypothetical protein